MKRLPTLANRYTTKPVKIQGCILCSRPRLVRRLRPEHDIDEQYRDWEDKVRA